MSGYISRNRHEDYSKELLGKIKPKVKAFVFDFDGTIKSSTELDCKPLGLINKIAVGGKHMGIVTASGASALEGLAQQIIKLILDNNLTVPVYLGIANGVALYKLDNKGRQELYSYSLRLDEINNILQAWKNVMEKINVKETDLVEKGLSTFNEFLKKDWDKYIANDLLELARKFFGRCFIEKLKVTFVMPKNEVFSQDRFVMMMQDEIDKIIGRGRFIIDMGDTVFAHVTHWPKMAPKLFVLNRIKSELGLNEDQVLAFGDMPFGNDKGLLIDSHLPYTFTNKYIDKKNTEVPPFLLPGSELTPVGSVYKAVDYLLLEE